MTAQRPPVGFPVAVDLVTPDLDQARSFYGPLLGWSFAKGDGPAVECRTDGGLAASLLPAPLPVSGWRTSFLGSADTAARIRQGGGEILAESDEGGVRVVHACDPGGATFAVAHGATRTPAQRGPGLPAWHELMTGDAEQADAFYPAVFGHEVLTPPGVEGYALFTVDHQPVAGRLVVPPELAAAVRSLWMVYFAAGDVDASAARAAELGGSVVAPPMDRPTGRLATIADPSGALFTLLRPAA